MQRRMRDWQILWVVLFGVGFWMMIWQHDTMVSWYRKSPLPKVVQWLESEPRTSSDR